jgi:hypothetical protein
MRERLLMLHEEAAKKAAPLALKRGADMLGVAAGFTAAAAAGFGLALLLDQHFSPRGGRS